MLPLVLSFPVMNAFCPFNCRKTKFVSTDYHWREPFALTLPLARSRNTSNRVDAFSSVIAQSPISTYHLQRTQNVNSIPGRFNRRRTTQHDRNIRFTHCQLPLRDSSILFQINHPRSFFSFLILDSNFKDGFILHASTIISTFFISNLLKREADLLNLGFLVFFRQVCEYCSETSEYFRGLER